MADLLKVDLDLLQQTAGALGLLVEEFDECGKIVDENHDCIGESTLIGTMNDFAGNWKTHRENLLKSMDSVYTMATKSHEAYLSADDALVQAIKSSETTQSVTETS